MGTFHDDRGELHGMTVVVDTDGPTVYVGRCDILDEVQIIIQDADVHEDGQEGLSKAEYLERAKKFGIWSRHPRLSIPMSAVSSVELLARYGEKNGSAPGRSTADSSADRAGASAQGMAESNAGEGEALLHLTASACEEVKRLLADEENAGKGLRLRVVGGGCSGLSYKLEFDDEREHDFVMASPDFSVFVDRKSAIYLRDVTLDYRSGLDGRGFVFKNPNASNTCGCGESFAL
jgi:iron-sulfur cluster assembly protein